MLPISLYIHIPFCKKKCRYCDFYSVPYENGFADDFISALVREWTIVKTQYGLSHAPIKSVFFGGGTPSLLSCAQWETVNSSFLSTLNVSADTEKTIECNPESFTVEKAMIWKNSGITRLTFGVQSLDNRELGLLGRPHNAKAAERVLKEPLLRDFKSVGADVMFGLPGQTPDSFANSLIGIVGNPVITHLSAYELTVNPDTTFGRHKSILPLPEEDELLAMTHALIDTCATHGFYQYEISNFAKPGFECVHNYSYWDHSPYIGLGPAAHSYIHPQRFCNVKSVSDYCSLLSKNRRPLDFVETLTPENMMNEMIFLRLRTNQGLCETDFFNKTGSIFYSEKRKSILDELVQNKYISKTGGTWNLSAKGMLVADGIAKRLS